VQAWYGGESGGQAVADVLFGDYNPAGKLPITFYKDSTQLAGFEDYSMKRRTYRFMPDPLFPFGYGLSYTTFTIGKAQLSKTEIQKNETMKLIVPIINTGKREGTEVVQIYIHKKNDTAGPLKTLRSFQRIKLAAGKNADVSIELAPSAFEFFDRDAGAMTVAAGEYEIWYGNSSNAKDLKLTSIVIK
jgi:beta-glucosidase